MSRLPLALLGAALCAPTLVAADMPAPPSFVETRQVAVAFGDLPPVPGLAAWGGIEVAGDLPAAAGFPKRVVHGDMPVRAATSHASLGALIEGTIADTMAVAAD